MIERLDLKEFILLFNSLTPLNHGGKIKVIDITV
jgi:hypothetical protein